MAPAPANLRKNRLATSRIDDFGPLARNALKINLFEHFPVENPLQNRQKSRARTRKEHAPTGKERAPTGKERAPTPKEHALFGRERAPTGKERTPTPEECAPAAKERAPTSRERTRTAREHALTGKECARTAKECAPNELAGTLTPDASARRGNAVGEKALLRNAETIGGERLALKNRIQFCFLD